MQKALKDQEQHHGASVEEMAQEVNKAKAVLQKAEKELRQMVQLNKVLKFFGEKNINSDYSTSLIRP